MSGGPQTAGTVVERYRVKPRWNDRGTACRFVPGTNGWNVPTRIGRKPAPVLAFHWNGFMERSAKPEAFRSTTPPKRGWGTSGMHPIFAAAA